MFNKFFQKLALKRNQKNLKETSNPSFSNDVRVASKGHIPFHEFYKSDLNSAFFHFMGHGYETESRIIAHELDHAIIGWKHDLLIQEAIAQKVLLFSYFYPHSQYQMPDVDNQIQQLKKMVFSHSSQIDQINAKINDPKRTQLSGRSSVLHAEAFQKLMDILENLESCAEHSPQVLYYLMEIEVLLGELEEKAISFSKKYEARLAASLRDISKLYEPSGITENQLKIFGLCVKALVEGWGRLTREKVSYIRKRLLEAGLTWLPVTEKAEKVIEESKGELNEGVIS